MTFGTWPQHVHAFKGVVDYGECLSITQSMLRSPAEKETFAKEDAALLQRERELIARLPGAPAGASVAAATGTSRKGRNKKRSSAGAGRG